jgi:hypothetical protein
MNNSGVQNPFSDSCCTLWVVVSRKHAAMVGCFESEKKDMDSTWANTITFDFLETTGLAGNGNL